jgi:monoamine oxidase
MPTNSFDVLIIGAGMAGLTAARVLAEAGQRVLVVEAQDRIGGRILTRHYEGQTIELGAEFIHGRPPELLALIAEAALEIYEREGSQMSFQDGALTDVSDDREDSFSILEGLEGLSGPDVSFATCLEGRTVSDQDRARMIGFVEGFNAADHRQISAQSLGRQQEAEDSIEGDRAFALVGGYHQLPAFLAKRIAAAGAEIRLETPVRAIHWRRDHVEAVTDAGSIFARRVVVTLPLGVLQAGAVLFMPPVEAIERSLRQLRMGHVQRFTLTFRERFWVDLPAAESLSFLFSPEEMPPVWWTAHPAESNALTGWVGGPRCEALAGLSPSDLIERALETLSRVFSLDAKILRGLLLRCDHHDWQADPWSLGAYSYVATGGTEASQQLSEPLENTLFFAGEHTDTTGHRGTVHAAIRSGIRAAAQVLVDASTDKRTNEAQPGTPEPLNARKG